MRSWRVLHLCLATVVCGCAAETTELEPTDAVETKSHRLVAWGYYHDDGAAIASQIHDVDLDIHCRPAPMSDGTHRCIPVAAHSYQHGLYIDPRCETPAIDVPGGSREVRYAVDIPSNCDERIAREVYEIGDVPHDEAYVLVDGRCRPYDGPIRLQRPPYFEVRRVEDDRFVAMTRELEPIGDGLARVVYGTEAGARFTTHVEDSTNGQVCSPSRFEGELLCGPNWYGFGLYGDETCGKIEGLALQGTTCVDPTYAVALTDVGFCSTLRPVRVDARADAVQTQYLRNRTNECVLAIPGGGSGSTYDVTEVDASAVFAPLELRPHAGERIHATKYTTSTGAEIGRFHRVLVDDAIGTECVPREVAGTLRCVPVDAHRALDAYLDDTCERSIRTISVPNGVAPPVVAYDAPEGLATHRGPIDRLREVGAVLDIESLYFLNGDTCVAGEINEWSMCRTQYLVGDEIDPRRYAPLNEGVIR